MNDRVAWTEKVGPEALTFDDVLLVPRFSAVHPRDVETRSLLGHPLIQPARVQVRQVQRLLVRAGKLVDGIEGAGHAPLVEAEGVGAPTATPLRRPMTE